MQRNVHSPNFEKCVCLTISVSSMDESQLHQVLLSAEFKDTVLKEIRAYLDPIPMRTFLIGSRHRVQSRSISYTWFPGLEFHSSESLLESKCPASDISQPLLLLSVAVWLVPDNEMWTKMMWVPSKPSECSLSVLYFLSATGHRGFETLCDSCVKRW